MNDKISIVTVTYNCKNFILPTINSIISQTYKNYEYIVIDGKSNDGTLEILQENKEYFSYLISEKDEGIFDAMNKAILVATGKWIIFMNAGDVFHDKNVLKTVFNQRIDENIGFIYGKSCHLKDSEYIYFDQQALPFMQSKKKFHNMGFNHQCVFVKTSLAKKIKFNLSYKVAADYDMINQIWKLGYNYIFVDALISATDNEGFSAKNRHLQRIEEARICGCENDIRFIAWNNYKLFRSFLKERMNKKGVFFDKNSLCF